MTTLILKSRDMVADKKVRLAKVCAETARPPQLLILHDSDNPVIAKYVELKKRFGAEIGAEVQETLADSVEELKSTVQSANQNLNIDGVIIQLPLRDKSATDELCQSVDPNKDVDGLGLEPKFLPATVKAILDLLDFYHIDLSKHRIAVVGRGKLVGAPLSKELKKRGLKPKLFHRGSDLTRLKNFNLIITATGVPGLIASSLVSPGTVLVDAGTASEKGVLRGDLDPTLYDRDDLAAITPKIGGVGPATVSCLFENLLTAHLQNQA